MGGATVGDGDDHHRERQQWRRGEEEEAARGSEGEGGKGIRSSGRQARHRKESTAAVFVALDYLFLLIFFGFLGFFLLQIWRGASAGGR